MMIAMKIVSSQHPLHYQCCLTPQVQCIEERDDGRNSDSITTASSALIEERDDDRNEDRIITASSALPMLPNATSAMYRRKR